MKSSECFVLPSLCSLIFCSLYMSCSQDLESWNKLSGSENCSTAVSVLFSLALILKTKPLGTYECITDAEQVSFKKWGSIWIICQATDDRKLFLTPDGMSDYFDNKLKQAWKLEITRIKLSPMSEWAPLFSTYSSILAINISSSLIEIGSLLLATGGIY